MLLSGQASYEIPDPKIHCINIALPAGFRNCIECRMPRYCKPSLICHIATCDKLVCFSFSLK